MAKIKTKSGSIYDCGDESMVEMVDAINKAIKTQSFCVPCGNACIALSEIEAVVEKISEDKETDKQCPNDETGTFDDLRVASTEIGWFALLKNRDVKVVRDFSDWKRTLDQVGQPDHPLYGCDEHALNRFTNSLKFENGGLAHANYGMLRSQITVAQFDRLWALFGISPFLMKDYNNKECAKRATCSTSYADVCTGNCYTSSGILLSELTVAAR